MLETWAWGTYIFFAVFLAGGIVWVIFALPETKGATLEEMDRVFGSRTGTEDAVLLAEARREIGLTLTTEEDAIVAVNKGDQMSEKRHDRAEAV